MVPPARADQSDRSLRQSALTVDLQAPIEISLLLNGEAATRRFGTRLAITLRAGDLLLLSGPLGAGKSSLARAVLQTLAGAAIDVPSPTFTLVELYEHGRLPAAHADLYRLEAPDEVEELGLDEVLAEGSLLIEWPERAGPEWIGRRRRSQLALRLTPLATEGDQMAEMRRLDLQAWGTWTDRLPGLANGFPAGAAPS